ncbi:MAG TPA: hypothetical protein VN408_04110, partial [Actinoplanes sp.]|nr:hypothetical protein [Actinoplanes sp.]
MADQLTAWMRVRERVLWPDVVPHLPPSVPAVRDGFTAYAGTGADPRRRSLLLAAHQDVRCAVAAGPGLS